MNTPRQAPPDFFPAVHSIVEGARLGQLVDHDFGLRASSAIYLIQSGLNDHYALGSPEGDFVIRVYRRGWRSNEAITWELGLIEHLARRGAPVAECVRRVDGSWFSEIQAGEGVRQVAVFRRAPGPYTHFGNTGRSRISPAACAEEFGRSVAEVHAAADSYQAQAPRFQLDLDHLLDQPLQAITQVYAHRKRDLDDLWQLANQLRQMLDSGGPLALDWGPCHGDMSGGNSTYWNGHVIHFDFDCAGPGWRAYDLGVFFWSLSINGHGADVWEPFLRGYSSRHSLPGADLSMVRVFAAMRVIWLMGLWCANAPVLGYHKLHDDYFDRELRRVSEFHQQAMG
ncbi:MAG: phosphotransferase enzyme family protein, partial [Roseiflexaceae bacterium]